MACNQRLEIRLPEAEKQTLARFAQERGTTVSDLIRRALKVAIGKPLPLETEEAIAVVGLRQRINMIEARMLEAEACRKDMASIRNDLDMARSDTIALIGR